jgi:outer membrane cobalamin receptor
MLKKKKLNLTDKPDTMPIKKFRAYLFMLVMLFPLAAFSQDGYFNGTVKDKSSGDPLIGAFIYLKMDPSLGTAADLKGAFSIKLRPGTYVFVVSFTGMQTDTVDFTLKPGQTIMRDVQMVPFVSQLKGVEITAGKFEKRFEEITVSMDVIRPTFIEAKNTRNIQAILDYSPGLNILDNEPQIRGGSGFTFGVGSKVAILVDDMPMLSGDAGRPFWDFIPIENAEQIEVTKGASSVLSGTSALSGAINIRTATPGLKPLTKITLYTGAYSSPPDKSQKWWNDYPYIAGANFLHTKKIGNLDLSLGGNLNFDHNYIGAPRPDSIVLNPPPNYPDSKMAIKKARVNFNLKKRSKKYQGLDFGVNGNFMVQSNPMILAWLNDTSGFFRGYPGAVIMNDQFIGNLDPFINYYSKVGIRHSLHTRALYNSSAMSNNQFIKTFLVYGDYNFKREYKFLDGLDFIGGLSTQYSTTNSNMYVGSGSDINNMLNVSAYGQLENDLFGIINLSVGARLEYYALNGGETQLKPIFRAGMTLRVLKETYVRASYGQGYRYPTIAEKYIRTNVGAFGVFENPDLQPESSWNAEIGVKQGFKFFKYYGYLDIAAFQQDYQNTVEYLFGFWDSTYSTVAGAGFKFLNTGRSRITGVDISVTGAAQLAKNATLQTMLGYNYIMPKTLEPDYVFARDIRDSSYNFINTSVNPAGDILKYRFLQTFKGDLSVTVFKFTVGFSAKYFSKIENLDKSIEDFENATKNTGGSIQPILYMNYFYHHNNGNWIFDARLAWDINDHHQVSVLSNNIFNRIYSLRPLKAEQMRSVMIQYIYKI